MKHVIGLMQPDAGTVQVDGIQVNPASASQLAPVRQRVSMLFQNAALFDSLTVRRNVAFHSHRAGVRDKNQGPCAAALGSSALDKRGDKLPVNLSGGMRKRASASPRHRRRAGRQHDGPTPLDPVVSDVVERSSCVSGRHGITSLVVAHAT